jgi:carbon-monoxide dehydrogenase large subunit
MMAATPAGKVKATCQPHELPYRASSGIVWDSGSFAESLERAYELIEYLRLRAEQRRGRSARRRTRIGIASYVKLTGVGSAIRAFPDADIATGTDVILRGA